MHKLFIHLLATRCYAIAQPSSEPLPLLLACSKSSPTPIVVHTMYYMYIPFSRGIECEISQAQSIHGIIRKRQYLPISRLAIQGTKPGIKKQENKMHAQVLFPSRPCLLQPIGRVRARSLTPPMYRPCPRNAMM